MKEKGPSFARASRLRDDNSPARWTQGELLAARQNARASVAFGEALAASLRGNKEGFGECPAAAKANRIGRPPSRDAVAATSASSLYSSTLDTKSRKR